MFANSVGSKDKDAHYQDSDSITQSELMRMMNDNSKDEEIQVGSYSSYVYTYRVCARTRTCIRHVVVCVD